LLHEDIQRTFPDTHAVDDDLRQAH
jgi:hypothetical protein